MQSSWPTVGKNRTIMTLSGDTLVGITCTVCTGTEYICNCGCQFMSALVWLGAYLSTRVGADKNHKNSLTDT